MTNPVAPKTDTPATQDESMYISMVHYRQLLEDVRAAQEERDRLRANLYEELELVTGDNLAEMQQRAELAESTLAAERAEKEVWKLAVGQKDKQIFEFSDAVNHNRDYALKLESELAAERASRLQAEDQAFNAGIEAAAKIVGGDVMTQWDALSQIRALSKPSVSPEQAEGTK